MSTPFVRDADGALVNLSFVERLVPLAEPGLYQAVMRGDSARPTVTAAELVKAGLIPGDESQAAEPPFDLASWPELVRVMTNVENAKFVGAGRCGLPMRVGSFQRYPPTQSSRRWSLPASSAASRTRSSPSGGAGARCRDGGRRSRRSAARPRRALPG